MFAHKHYRELSLQAVLKGRQQECRSPEVQGSGESSPRSVAGGDLLKDTPKMVACVLQPLSLVLTETDEPSPVAAESSLPLHSSSFDQRTSPLSSRVFNKTIHRLPAKRALIGRAKDEVSQPLLPLHGEPMEEARRKPGKNQRKSLLWRPKHSPKKPSKKEKDEKFSSSCAVLIQNRWRTWKARRDYIETIRQRYQRATACLLGWKCRRIMRLKLVQKAISKVRTATRVGIRALKRDFLSLLSSLWEGDWLNSVKSYGEKKVSTPAKRPQRFFQSFCRTEESVASTEESCSLHQSPSKGFDSRLSPDKRQQRRSKTVSTDLALQEFLHLEKSVYENCEQQLIRLIPVSVKKERKSVIPRLNDDSAFWMSLTRIEHAQVFEELKQLLDREFLVLRQ